ncbi:KCTD1_15 [Mytilus edulis]|uniref:KCTD1_15 n=1 Tax=Mytilus edulis TaxID=6550 RepID=A0A8S3RYM8_MYTED|nr:KCTD1_15 [Mytilus edulis]
MATSDDDFDMTELDLLGPLIPNFHLETDVLDGLESADLTVPEETTGKLELVNDPEKHQDLIDMMEVVDGIAEENKEKTTGGRFPIVSSNEKENMLDEALSKSTKKQTKYGVKIFRQWLTDREKDATFENYTIEQLNDALTEFYAEVRNTGGEYYAKSTLVGIRASINRHLRAPPFSKTYSIMSDDSAFLKSNKMFLAMIKKVQREGMDRTKHHSSISEGDLHKLRSSDALSTENPKTLQRQIWFDLVLSFGRRGRENQRFFTDKTFVVKSDDCSHRYVEMAVSETTKNHKGGLDDNQNIIKPRMYETKKPDCPVAALTKYLSKRNPTSNIFFQQPRVKVNNEDEMWYTSRPVGERLLNNMMVDISKSAGLSQIYTNHCVRATTVTVLAQSGVPKTDIMKITGHKSEASLESYYQDSSEKQKRQYSAILLGNTENGSDKSGSTAPVPICTQSNAMPLPPNPATSFNTHCLNLTNTQINNQMSLPVLYNKQFEVHNSTVQVFNYNITGNAAQP